MCLDISSHFLLSLWNKNQIHLMSFALRSMWPKIFLQGTTTLWIMAPRSDHGTSMLPRGTSWATISTRIPLKFVVLFRFRWFRNIYAKEGSYLKHHPLCKIKRKFSKHIFSTNLVLSTSLYKNPWSWPTMIRKCWSYKQDSALLIRNHGLESKACALSDIGLSLAKTAGGRP